MRDMATERPTTEPRERKRYEVAVAIAWSVWPALATREMRVVVIPEPRQ